MYWCIDSTIIMRDKNDMPVAQIADHNCATDEYTSYVVYVHVQLK